MSESPIETHELREQLEESTEHAHGHHGGGESPQRWTLYLSLSTAIIAVFAAITALQSSSYESKALIAKNDAILAQSKATDSWAYFQAKGMKAAIYEVQAQVTTSPEQATKLKEQQAKYKAEQDDIEKEARKLEEEVKTQGEVGEEAFHHHHRFALGVTIFQVAIALAAIAALTRRKPLWYVSMLVGASGFVFFLMGFGLLGG